MNRWDRLVILLLAANMAYMAYSTYKWRQFEASAWRTQIEINRLLSDRL